MSGPKQLSNLRISAQNINSSVAALHVVQLDSTGGIITGGVGGGSTQVSVREILTSSGASVMDSTNNAIGVTIRAGSAAGTEYVDGDVDVTPNFGAIGFNNGSNTMRVVSTVNPLPVFTVGGVASTIVTVSTGSVRVGQSSAADLQVTTTPVAGSTWRTQPGSTLWASSAGFHFDSSGALQVTGISGNGSTQVTVSQLLDSSGGSVAAADSANQAIRVNVVAGAAAGSTIVTVSALPLVSTTTQNSNSSALNVRVIDGPSSAANFSVRPMQSSAADLQVTATPVAGSTWRTQPGSTLWASSAGFHFDSSGALQITGTFSASTTVNVSSLAGFVTVRGSTSANSSDVVSVRISDGSTWVPIGVDYTDGSTTSTLVGPAIAFNNSSNNTMRLVGSSTPLPTHIRTSSGADMSDSTNNALRVNVVAGAAGGSTIVTISTVQGTVLIAAASTAATAYVPARLTDGSNFLPPALEYTDGSTTSTLAAGALAFNNSSNNTMRLVGSSTPLPTHIRTSSGADMSDSTNNALRVNVVAGAAGGSTVNTVSAYLSTSGDAVTVGDTVNAAIRVNVVAGAAGGSTIVTVSTGSVRVGQSSAADLQVTATPVAGSTWATRPLQSSAADLQMTATPASGSTWRTQPGSTLWASSAGFHFDSSGGLQVNAGSLTASTEQTVRQSTYTDFNTLSRLADRDNATNVAAIVNATQPASSAYGLVVRMPAPITDSTNNALRVNVVAGAAGGSTEQTVRQSTYTDFNTLSRLADRDQSTQVAAVLNATPASTAYALAVREVAPSTGPFAISSIAGVVTVSTGPFAISSIAGPVTVSSVGGFVNVLSTANLNSSAYLPVRVTDGSTFLPAALEYTDGSTVSTLVGPALAYINGSNTTMRLVGTTQPLPVQLRTGINTFASTSVLVNSSATTAVYTLVSSVAGTKICGFAYSITSTVVGSMLIEFMSSGAGNGGGSTGNIWGLVLGSGSSGVVGANLAVPHPSRLFATASGEALGMRLGTTGVDVRVSIATFNE